MKHMLQKRLHHCRITILSILCILLHTGFAYAGQQKYCEELLYDAEVVMIHAEVDALQTEYVPSYRATKQNWEGKAISNFLYIAKYFTENQEKTRFELEEGKVLLLNEAAMERIAFLHNPDESFHYMTARSDVFYNHAQSGAYRQVAAGTPSLEDAFLYQNTAQDGFYALCGFLAEKGVEVGMPIEMTSYYLPDKADAKFPEEIVVAFPQLINGIRLMPWGQVLNIGDYTCHTFIVLYQDRNGITDLQIPMLFESVVEMGRQKVLSFDDATKMYAAVFNSFLSQAEPPAVDYIALEYAPIQKDSSFSVFDLIPVWSFYTDYHNDDARTVISLNAFTGEQVF